MKYFAVNENGFETLIIFNESESHRDIASKFTKNPVSAGFVNFDANGNLKCYGSSDTLNLKCREVEDNILLRIGFKK